MYFRNRAQAGRKLARLLKEYRNENIAVLALSPGGVIVGAQIAMQLHGNLGVLLTENIYLPGEYEALASMTSTGTFTYNNMFSPGQLEEFIGEYNQFIEMKRIETFHHLNRVIGNDGEIHKEQLRNHTIVLVSDGLSNGFSLDVAWSYLKTVAIKRLIIATPLASVTAVDRMHLVGDEIQCLSVPASYFSTDHYYDDNTIPPMEDLFRIIRNISVHWDRSHS